MKVLVTGACGFIGYSVCREFHELGYSVIGWDLNERESKWELCKIDLYNQNMVKRKLKEISPDIIIHCAGAADVGKSVENPYFDYNSNVTVTHDLLFLLHELEMHSTRFVFLSSAGVYGNPINLPITEDMDVNPMSPYALHKVMCEDVCRYFSDNYEMDIKIIRIFSAYGEGLRKQIFWDMHKKVEKTGRLSMFGTGNESRDYINIIDLIRAIYIVATKAPKTELIYNVANGEEITIREATECFANAIGINLEMISFTGEKKEGNPINWKADISKLKMLGYKKTVEFSEGIARYIEWVGEKE